MSIKVKITNRISRVTFSAVIVARRRKKNADQIEMNQGNVGDKPLSSSLGQRPGVERSKAACAHTKPAGRDKSLGSDSKVRLPKLLGVSRVFRGDKKMFWWIERRSGGEIVELAFSRA